MLIAELADDDDDNAREIKLQLWKGRWGGTAGRRGGRRKEGGREGRYTDRLMIIPVSHQHPFALRLLPIPDFPPCF